ncbi:hypothetical protein ZOD2009_22242 [Haladaptatus paucihalophilus DX253]|uniref:Uncharacterized protein n=1 Tax=Haladaptatus paucihalophilus DX253 TaxID=797209 RepID=E7R054_HALPU|nr:hypothetical protein ZOD2009_22242 [Haladaptatus paucihalophilus DX253]
MLGFFTPVGIYFVKMMSVLKQNLFDDTDGTHGESTAR